MSPDEQRQRARLCEQLASNARSKPQREELLSIARDWRELAERVERSEVRTFARRDDP